MNELGKAREISRILKVCKANCDGVIDSNGYNLSSDTNCGGFVQTGDQQDIELLLGPLQANGGATWTRIPRTGSVAINTNTHSNSRAPA